MMGLGEKEPTCLQLRQEGRIGCGAWLVAAERGCAMLCLFRRCADDAVLSLRIWSYS